MAGLVSSWSLLETELLLKQNKALTGQPRSENSHFEMKLKNMGTTAFAMKWEWRGGGGHPVLSVGTSGEWLVLLKNQTESLALLISDDPWDRMGQTTIGYEADEGTHPSLQLLNIPPRTILFWAVRMSNFSPFTLT